MVLVDDSCEISWIGLGDSFKEKFWTEALKGLDEGSRKSILSDNLNDKSGK
jgi:hypothetical protein